MKRLFSPFAGFALAGVLAFAATNNATAETWQSENTQAAPTDWQQRVLKKPQTSQWHAVGQAANQVQTVNYEQEPVEPEQPLVERNTVRHQAARQPVLQNPYAHNVGSMSRDAGAPGRQRVALTAGEEIIEPGPVVRPQPEQQFEPLANEGTFAEAGGCDSCGGECDGCDSCGGVGRQCRELCKGWEVFDGCCGPYLKGLSVFAGFDGFKGSADMGRNGNFGVNEGLNFARPLGDPWNCGYQIGANFVQSDFTGAPVASYTTSTGDHYDLNAAYRKQYFVTAGLFRRADELSCLQGGIAFDYMYDMYYTNNSLQQLRSETSLMLDQEYEIGYYGAYSINKDRTIDGKLEATDMFAGFIRKRFENGGDGRIWGGATGKGDGLIGVDLWVPLGKGFAIENRVNCVIPKQGANSTGQTRESWGLLVQLVWYPGQNAKCQQQNPYRPLFNVADNSLFMIDREGQ